VVPPGAQVGSLLLYLHGGGFLLGSIRSHGELVARLARATGVRALVPEYRLLPGYRYPAALDDAHTVWHWLRGTGVQPGSVVLAGDSAGGALVTALLVALREAGAQLPAAAVLFSPLLDMTASGESIEARAQRDPIFNAASIRATAADYVGDADPTAPLVSPLFAALAGLPPLLVQVGTEEVLFSDAERFVDAAKAAGVDATLDVGEGLPHVYQSVADAPEAREATARAGAFLRRAMAVSAAR
jgi:epsilon-lactone hydrolase